MSRGPKTFKDTDLRRAMNVVRAVGFNVAGVRVDQTGAHIVFGDAPAGDATETNPRGWPTMRIRLKGINRVVKRLADGSMMSPSERPPCESNLSPVPPGRGFLFGIGTDLTRPPMGRCLVLVPAGH
jgi:hypothetical protein